MSPVRAVRTVTDPSGQQWELYVSRVALPAWRQGGYNGWLDDPGPGDGRAFLLELPFALVGFVWSGLVWPALRFLCLFPGAVVKGRRSHAARIEAVSIYPEEETRLWTTTTDMVDSVLNQIALGLEEGRVVQPVGAVYSGSRSR